VGWIDLSIYSRPRRFQEPFLKITEKVGVQSIIWAFVFGPFFFWKKGALAEALLMVLSTAPLLEFGHDDGRYHFALSEIPYLSAVIWAAFAILAPALLVMHYRRKGWLEIT